MGQAIQYSLNQWEALCVYTTDDGRLAIDNNASENALRRVAIGRKNWLFAGSDNGGPHRRDSVQPDRHLPASPGRAAGLILRDVLTRIAAIPISQLASLACPTAGNPATAQ